MTRISSGLLAFELVLLALVSLSLVSAALSAGDSLLPAPVAWGCAVLALSLFAAGAFELARRGFRRRVRGDAR
ncbi:hypothetical protein [Actinopolyspora mortivallis]|uniref:hypothetical protein n=1 Tax=Actinopolyspora mortivallis TaxID=33906 RepID=UPI00036BE8B2|nr:hypothetical protein [Actinopolyspora mortivallis]